MAHEREAGRKQFWDSKTCRTPKRQDMGLQVHPNCFVSGYEVANEL